MKEIEDVLTEPLKEINLFIDEVRYEKEKTNTLYITLYNDSTIDMDKIVEASKVISSILDKYDFIKEKYVLDVSSKEKGKSKNE